MNGNGDWCEEKVDIHDITIGFFKKLFQFHRIGHFKEILEAGEPCVSNEMNNFLLADFKAKKVYTTIKQMNPTEAPRHDGMPVLFYQQFWNIVSDRVKGSKGDHPRSQNLGPLGFASRSIYTYFLKFFILKYFGFIDRKSVV